MKYQAVVDMTKLNKNVFTYKRMGKDANGKDVEVFVEHVPYKELSFTDPDKQLNTTTGDIVKTLMEIKFWAVPFGMEQRY